MLMELQDELTLPLGTVMKSLGLRPPRSHLFDAHLAVTKMNEARSQLPDAARKEDRRLQHIGV
tara:strand:- start:396 stop:584 length:189 start_codon:yes stop_codon:yes gene_type:complete